MSSVNWSLKEHSRNVHELKMKVTGPEPQYVLFLSDIHWDNPGCDRNLLKRHLDEAVEYDAPVIIPGDFFCAMQGKYDHRSCKSKIRSEHQKGDYLDRLVETAAEWLKPYSKHIAVIGDGNHETAIKRHHETDLLDRLCYRLRADGGITRHGGYTGWVKFICKYYTGNSSMNRTMGRGFTCRYFHGHGGGGPVSKGMIDWNRYTQFTNADIYVAGHIHRLNHDVSIREELTNGCKVRKSEVDYVRLGTYKDAWGDAEGGFEVERNHGPRALGGYWCKFFYRDNDFQKSWMKTE